MKSIPHKVFINDTLLCFAGVYDATALAKAEGKIISAETTDIMDVIKELEKRPQAATYYYLSSNPEASWQLFLSHYTLIEASGGLVQNKEGKYLAIFRRGKWDLPKGKVEYDESPEQAGVREVEEECGIHDLEIIKTLPSTFHTYHEKNKDYLKKTHWYLMNYEGKDKLKPQTEEDIEKVEWMSSEKIKSTFYKNTYQSIKELLNEIII